LVFTVFGDFAVLGLYFILVAVRLWVDFLHALSLLANRARPDGCFFIRYCFCRDLILPFDLASWLS
jgi:hypothetical protein